MVHPLRVWPLQFRCSYQKMVDLFHRIHSGGIRYQNDNNAISIGIVHFKFDTLFEHETCVLYGSAIVNKKRTSNEKNKIEQRRHCSGSTAALMIPFHMSQYNILLCMKLMKYSIRVGH